MAVGKAGETADRDQLAIWFGDIWSPRTARSRPSYREAIGAAYMKQPRDRDHRRCRRRPAARPPCGPAISRKATSTSTPTTGLDVSISSSLNRQVRAWLSVRCARSCSSRPARSSIAEGGVLIAQRPAGRPLAGLLGVSRRQGRAGRDAGGGADPRAQGGARHRDRRGRSRAAHLRQPRLSRLSSADAALSLPALAGAARPR